MYAVLFAAAVSSDITADEVDDIDEVHCDALITDLKCSCDISRIQSIDSILCIEDLQGWYEEVEHWRPTNSGNSSKKSNTEYSFFFLLQFYISQWISGKNPPLRCHYRSVAGEQCMKCAVPKETYCVDHRCLASGSACMNPRELSCVFCSFHRCSFALCKLERMGETISTCCDHSCPICVRINPANVNKVDSNASNLLQEAHMQRTRLPQCPVTPQQVLRGALLCRMLANRRALYGTTKRIVRYPPL